MRDKFEKIVSLNEERQTVLRSHCSKREDTSVDRLKYISKLMVVNDVEKMIYCEVS